MSRKARWMAGSRLGAETLFERDMDDADERCTIQLLVRDNPKRGEAAKRFALYSAGMTIKQYVAAVGDEKLARADLAWDQNHLFIRLAPPSQNEIWSVLEAKAKLSEILRRARAGRPQTIGNQDPCVVVSVERFEQMSRSGHLGRFLIESAPRGIELKSPSRADHRGDPFADH